MRLRPLFSAPRSAARVVVRGPSVRGFVSPVLGFADPRRVMVCVRRNVRKQVLHAFGVAGRGVKRGKRGPLSDIRCG